MIHALRTKITLNGRQTFTNNFAGYGGRISTVHYEQRKLVYLKANTTVQFLNNNAQHQGVAIAIEDSLSMDCASYAEHQTYPTAGH